MTVWGGGSGDGFGGWGDGVGGWVGRGGTVWVVVTVLVGGVGWGDGVGGWGVGEGESGVGVTVWVGWGGSRGEGVVGQGGWCVVGGGGTIPRQWSCSSVGCVRSGGNTPCVQGASLITVCLFACLLVLF